MSRAEHLVPRSITIAGSGLVAALALTACGADQPIDGWGPGAPPQVVVTVAPADASIADAAASEEPSGEAPDERVSEPGEESGAGESAAPPPSEPSPTEPSSTEPPSTEPPSPQYAPNGQTVRVRSLDNSFRNETVEVVVGTEILWTNDGRNEHDVLPADDAQTWGITRDDFEPGDEYRHVFLEPGTYAYYCSLHGTKDVGMIGTIVVTT